MILNIFEKIYNIERLLHYKVVRLIENLNKKIDQLLKQNEQFFIICDSKTKFRYNRKKRLKKIIKSKTVRVPHSLRT